jgi:invasion protein IalB
MHFTFAVIATLPIVLAMSPAQMSPAHAETRWAKYCGKDNNAHDVCFTGQNSRTETGQPGAAVALIEPAWEGKKLFRAVVPVPLQVPFGMRLIIDEESPRTGTFFACHANGCMADYEATPDLIGKLTEGGLLQIQAVDLKGQVVAFSLSLSDQTGNSFRNVRERPPAGAQRTEVYDRIYPASDTQAPGALTYSRWQKVCQTGSADGKKVCFTGQAGRTEAGQPAVYVMLIEPAGDPKKLLRVTVPIPVQVQHGARLIIDEDPPSTVAFITCLSNQCMADWEATPDLIGRLKGGQMLRVQMVNLAGTRLTFPVPLSGQTGDGFRQVADGPPTR